jgi:hypothetical protein
MGKMGEIIEKVWRRGRERLKYKEETTIIWVEKW